MPEPVDRLRLDVGQEDADGRIIGGDVRCRLPHRRRREGGTERIGAQRAVCRILAVGRVGGGIVPAHRDAEGRETRGDALHVCPPGVICVGPEHDVAPGEHAQHVVSRRAARARHRADGGDDAAREECVRRVLPLCDDHERCRVHVREPLAPVERQVGRAEAAEAAPPVRPAPPHALAAGSIHADVLGDDGPRRITERPYSLALACPVAARELDAEPLREVDVAAAEVADRTPPRFFLAVPARALVRVAVRVVRRLRAGERALGLARVAATFTDAGLDAGEEGAHVAPRSNARSLSAAASRASTSAPLVSDSARWPRVTMLSASRTASARRCCSAARGVLSGSRRSSSPLSHAT